MNLMIIDCVDKVYYDVAEKIIEKGRSISHIATSYDYEDFSKRDCFKNTTFLDRKNFTHAELIIKLNLENDDCLSKQIIEDFTECENLFLSISDRLSFFPLSVRERKYLYYELLLYWHSFFKRNSIDRLLFYGSPHMAWTIVVYYVAQKQNIPIRYISKTLINNRIMIAHGFRKLHKVPVEYLKNYQKDDIKNIIGKDLMDDVFRSSLLSQFSKEINQQALSDKEGIKEITKRKLKGVFHVKRWLNLVWNLYCRIKDVFSSVPGIFKEASVRHAFYFNPHLKNLTVDFVTLLFKMKIFSLCRYYNNHVTAVNYDSKFVFFALHYQPEATTLPLGGVFDNQLLAIKILSESIPEDWTICVKEHPRQFATKSFSQKNTRKGRSLQRRHFRNEEDYRKLLQMKNVRLIGLREDSAALIRKSVFAATITGSVAWESLLARKACMIFGNSWNSSCNSCYVVTSVEECKQAIQDILKKPSTEVELDFLKFLAYCKEKFIVSVPVYKYAKKSDMNYDLLIDNFAESILKSTEAEHFQKCELEEV